MYESRLLCVGKNITFVTATGCSLQVAFYYFLDELVNIKTPIKTSSSTLEYIRNSRSQNMIITAEHLSKKFMVINNIDMLQEI